MGLYERTLTIKRVPTVLSNYQEEEEEERGERAGCGRNCLGKCCLLVSKLPLYAFKHENGDASGERPLDVSEEEPPISLIELLLGQWENRMTRGLFRYDVTLCETRIIPGRLGFIAQLNEGRHLKKRPTEFRVDQVLQSFDEKKFNFTKVGQEEVLFRFETSHDQNSHFYPSAAVASELDSPIVVAINVSPIEYGHVLLIPRVSDCIPQKIDHASFLVALCMAKEADDPFFRVGYNSLGAFATVNHLHFQAYYLQVPFPVEIASTDILSEASDLEGKPYKGVRISRLTDYPVRGLVFESGTIQNLSAAISSSCIFLQDNNIPFNIFISGFGKRIFLFPQCYAEKQALGEVSHEMLETQVNPACWEISGHIVLKRKEDYEKASEEYAWRLLAEVSLSEERFDVVKAQIIEALGFEERYMEGKSHNKGRGEEDFEETPNNSQKHLFEECLVSQ